MKTFRRIFASCLILVLMVTAIPEICISSFATETKTEQTSDSEVTDMPIAEDDKENYSIEEQVQETVMYTTATTSEVVIDAEITRAEWLHNLVLVFDMVVESEAIPDNYFSDLDKKHKYYEDILLAVEFGVVEVEAGAELRPDDGVTREFAISTLNYCLGYQLDENATYTYEDSDECIDPVSAQIAIDRGWVEVIDNCFKPEIYLTASEAEGMLADAETTLEGQVIDENHENVYEFAEDVIVIAEGTDVKEGDNGVIFINDCPEAIAVGNKFAVHMNGIPNVYTATSVSTEENVTVIGTEALDTDSAFETIDVEGTINSDAMEIIPAEGVNVTFEEDNTGIANFGTKALRDIKVDMPLKFNGLTGKLAVKIKNPYLEYSVNSTRAFVTLNGVTEVTYSISGNLLEMGGFNQGFTLFTCNVGGIGSFDVAVNVSFSGSASGTVKGVLVAGVEVEKGVGVRAIRGFTQKEYYTNVDATASVSLKTFLGVTKLPVIKAYIYAEAGMTARFKKTSYSDEKTPTQCAHYAAYLFAKFGASVSAKFGNVQISDDITHNIFDENNSPVRIVNHYEDGNLVAKCTRGNTYANYFTNVNSRWSGCGWTGANGTYALNTDGTPFVLYKYTLNENNEATITKYNGNAWSVYVPKEIDGYTVVGIGNSAFAQKDCRYVVIPDTVTSIGSYAFRYCYNLYSVTLPDNLTNLDSNAFESCTSLTDVEIPSSLETIEFETFQNCISLRKIVIPDSVTIIDSSAFEGCTSLKDVILSKNLTKLGIECFAKTAIESIHIPKSLTEVASISANYSSYEYEGQYYQLHRGPFLLCESLKNVYYESGITEIAKGLFAGCVGLEKIVIPDTVTTVESYAFQGCLQSSELHISDNVTTIESSAFESCISLKEVTLSKNLTTLGLESFAKTGIESVYIPKSLTKVANISTNHSSHKYNGQYYQLHRGPFLLCESLKNVYFENGTTEIASGLFAGCVGLEKIVVPDTVTTIESYAFQGCLQLNDVTIGAVVTTIQYNAFETCISLEEIVIPNSVTNIGSCAFDSCTSLKQVTLSQNLKTLGLESFARTAIESIHIPKSLKEITNVVNNSSSYTYEEKYYNLHRGAFLLCEELKEVSFETGTTEIVCGLFAGCIGLEKIVIPDTVTTIREYAFQGCLQLNDVTIANTVKIIQYNAFADCISLSTIELPNGLALIGGDTFEGCISLKTIKIPDSVNSIGEWVFNNCNSLESVTLPSKSNTIAYRMFNNCSSLKTIEIPKTVTTIQEYAFYGCTSLENFTFAGESSLVDIQQYAFYNCSSLKEAILPETLESIRNYAFQKCTALEKVYIPQSTNTLGSYAFQGCEMLSEVTIADYSITAINVQTFKDCPALQKVVLPKGLTSIGSQAFMNCTSLAETVIPESVTSIDSTAFSYPEKMTVLGKSNSVAETFATENGFKFVDNSIPAEGFSLVDGIDYIVMDRGETYRAIFEFYPENSTDVVTLTASNTNVTIKGHDIYARNIGDTVITATTSSGVSYEFTIHIRNANKIDVVAQPNKVSYIMGEELDLAGVVVQVTYNDASTKNITDYTVSGFDSSVEGTNTITVTWISPSKTTYTTTFDVEIIDPRPKLTGIVIDTMPLKREYERKESLDLTGMVIKANYTDGSSVEVTDYTISGYNALQNGIQTITVSYNGFTTTFTVAVGQALITLGDVNDDGVVDAGDAVLISMYDAGLITLTSAQLLVCDVNKDGVVDAGDAVLISMYDAGFITEF